MPSRFIRPDTTILKISHGDTLTVKRRLTAGEQRAAFQRMYLAGADGTLKVNPMATGVATIAAFLVDWSLTDEEGRVVVIRDQPVETLLAALDAIEPESFAEILAAITTHEEAMARERLEEKKLQATPPPLPVMSGSALAPDGVSIGSAT